MRKKMRRGGGDGGAQITNEIVRTPLFPELSKTKEISVQRYPRQVLEEILRLRSCHLARRSRFELCITSPLNDRKIMEHICGREGKSADKLQYLTAQASLQVLVNGVRSDVQLSKDFAAFAKPVC